MKAARLLEGWRWQLGAAAVALLGVGLRLAHWPLVFADGRFAAPGTDPYYHLRRAALLLAEWPNLVSFDPAVSYPAGATLPWPPGFDLLLAGPGWLDGAAAALAGWGALLPPLLGGLGIYLLMRLARSAFGPGCALLAGLWLAGLHDAIDLTQAGRIDHHGLVAPLFLGAFLAAGRAAAADRLRACLLWGALCALAVALAVASIPLSPPVFYLPLFAALVALRFSDRTGRARRAALACHGLTTAAVLLVVLLVGDLHTRPFALYLPSLFTVLLFGLAAAVGWLVFLPRRRLWIGAVGLLAGLGVLALAVPATWVPLREALAIASGATSSYAMADEARSLLAGGELLTSSGAIGRYTYLIVLAPVFWLAMLLAVRRHRPWRFERLLVLAYGLLGLGLLLVQARFAEYAAPAVALLFAWAMLHGGAVFVRFARQAPSRTRVGIYAACLIGLLAVALAPLGTSLHAFMGRDPTARPRSLLAFLERAEPRLAGRPGTLHYGVLTSWLDAHPFLYATGRPVMVSSFGTRDADRMNRIGFSILLADDERTAWQRLRAHDIRYLLVSSIHRQINTMARMAGLDRRLMEVATGVADGRFVRRYQPLQPFRHCLHTRLFLGDGAGRRAGGVDHRGLAHFRLLAESRQRIHLFGAEVPRFRLFEVVPGARLRGRAPPNASVRLRLPLVTETGRAFDYRRQIQAGPDGRFELGVPYATPGPGRHTPARGPYRLRLGDGRATVEVTLAQVRSGAGVAVVCATPDAVDSPAGLGHDGATAPTDGGP